MGLTKTVIFGAGATGQKIYQQIKHECTVLFFSDNDETKYGTTFLDLPIKDKRELLHCQFDQVIIASYPGLNAIRKTLIEELHVDPSKIVASYVENSVMARRSFLACFAQLACDNHILGDVCEVGVYQGEFAKYINHYFPDRTLHLFDTFEGFSAQDLQAENEEMALKPGHFSNTSMDLVREKMEHPAQCQFHKGYFPESYDLPPAAYCFVSLDVDLYKPTLAALERFYPLLSKGGVILIDDYFTDRYSGIKRAVEEFAATQPAGITSMPIGDELSIAIIKT